MKKYEGTMKKIYEEMRRKYYEGNMKKI